MQLERKNETLILIGTADFTTSTSFDKFRCSTATSSRWLLAAFLEASRKIYITWQLPAWSDRTHHVRAVTPKVRKAQKIHLAGTFCSHLVMRAFSIELRMHVCARGFLGSARHGMSFVPQVHHCSRPSPPSDISTLPRSSKPQRHANCHAPPPPEN